MNDTNLSKSGYNKVVKCCRLARSQGYDWLWCDTCCINKDSSAELSEAINSMFEWYKKASVCHVILNDLVLPTFHERPDLSNCRWIKRGWTLQELLAPTNVHFYEQESMTLLGTKRDLASQLAEATGIETKYLLSEAPLRSASIAKRMSWAAGRSTTRMEDEAYCLLGLFDVNMPLLYGEGPKAYQRLQLELVSQSDDDSIFAWAASPTSYNTQRCGLSARSPAAFAGSRDIERERYSKSFQLSTLAKKGIFIHRTAIPFTAVFQRLVQLPDLDAVLPLQCGSVSSNRRFRQVVIYLQKDTNDPNAIYRRVGWAWPQFEGFTPFPYVHNWLATQLYRCWFGTERLLLDPGFGDPSDLQTWIYPEWYVVLGKAIPDIISAFIWLLWPELLLSSWSEIEPSRWEVWMTIWMLWQFSPTFFFLLYVLCLSSRLMDYRVYTALGLPAHLTDAWLWIADPNHRWLLNMLMTWRAQFWLLGN